MGTADKGVGEIGRGFPDLDKVLRGGCPGSFIIWVGDMVDVTTHWEDFGWIPPQSGPHNDGTETTEGTRWEVGVYPVGGGNIECKVTGGG